MRATAAAEALDLFRPDVYRDFRWRIGSARAASDARREGSVSKWIDLIGNGLDAKVTGIGKDQ